MSHHRHDLRIAVLLVAALLGGSTACRLAGGSTYVVAVGARDELPTWQGPCDTASAKPDGLVEFEGRFYRAVKPGSVTMVCRDGKLVLDVRPVHELRITGPDTVGGSYVRFQVEARDKKGQSLTLGHYASVAWSVPAGLEQGEGCHGDIMPSCEGGDSVRVRAGADAAGDLVLRASFGGKSAEKTVNVRSR